MPRVSTETRIFDPDVISVLGSALDGAWSSLMSTGQVNGNAETVRTELAKQVILMATQGERDRQRLIRGALVRFKRTSLGFVKDGHHEDPSSVPAV